MSTMRLDKLLSEMGAGTRKEIKKQIKNGLVTVNGQAGVKPEMKVDPVADIIKSGGKTVVYEKFQYYMMNKPAGIISAVTDSRERTVLDLIKEKDRTDLFPAGRLDKDTEGLLLITNDGALAHDMLSPGRHVPKTYYSKIEGTVTPSDVLKFEKGLSIGEKNPTLPAKLEILYSGNISEVLLTIEEGKFHQVKRMFHAVNKNVLYLKRTAFGPLTLDESIPPGSYRRLHTAEIEKLRKATAYAEK